MAYADPTMKKKPGKEAEEISKLTKEGMDLSKLIPRKVTTATALDIGRAAVTESVVSSLILNSVLPDAKKTIEMYKSMV